MTQQLSNNNVKWFADKSYQKVENLGFDQRKQNTTCNTPTPQFSYNKLLFPIFHVIIVKVYDRIYT